jgi:hypothetical protein
MKQNNDYPRCSHLRVASHTPAPGSVGLLSAPILVNREDSKGVQIATRTLADELARVTGVEARKVISRLTNEGLRPKLPLSGEVLLVLNSQSLIVPGKHDTTTIKGIGNAHS